MKMKMGLDEDGSGSDGFRGGRGGGRGRRGRFGDNGGKGGGHDSGGGGGGGGFHDKGPSAEVVDYKYYEYQPAEEEKVLSQSKEVQTPHSVLLKGQCSSKIIKPLRLLYMNMLKGLVFCSFRGPSAKGGHHMGDYVPQEELEKFLATCNEAAAQKAANEATDRAVKRGRGQGRRARKRRVKEGERNK